jgi:tRNA pseudouridine55 synthase
MDENISGLLIIDKEKGMTSHDVVSCVRGKFKIKKVGHAGTLDPMATGVIILLLGKATKLSNKFLSQEKEYEAMLKLGEITKSGDAEEKAIPTNTDIPDTDRIKNVIFSFTGRIKQIPPMFSAKKKKGKPLYKFARKGITVEREPVDIEIKKMEILDIEIPFVKIRVSCSKGTYIRQLAVDIGGKLGCGAYLADLRRTRSGDYRLDKAIPFAKIKNMSVNDLNENITRI